MIPKYVATPCVGDEEMIRPNGTGDTPDAAVAALLAQPDWVETHEALTDSPCTRQSEVTINVFKGVTPQEAGWDDPDNDEMGFEWCIGDVIIESRTVPNPHTT